MYVCDGDCEKAKNKIVAKNNRNKITVLNINKDQFYSSLSKLRLCTSSNSLILVRSSLTRDSVSASLRRRAINSSWRWPITVCASSSSNEEAEVILLVWNQTKNIITYLQITDLMYICNCYTYTNKTAYWTFWNFWQVVQFW